MRSIAARLESVLGAIDGIVRIIVVTALLSMTAVLFLNSIGRSVLNMSFVGGPALGRLLVIWLTFLGAYLAVRSRSHITVDLVRRLLPEHIVDRLTIFVGLFSAATCAWITWLSASFTWTRFAAGQIDPMLEIPSGIFYLPVPIGTCLMTLAFLQLAMVSAISEDAAQSPASTRAN